MRNETELTPADHEFEAALRGLRPTSPGVDTDRLLFDAGRASARQSLWFWRTAAAIVLVVGGLSWIHRPEPHEIEHVVHLSPETVIQVDGALADGMTAVSRLAMHENSYLRLQHRVLTEGLDALPDARNSSTARAVKIRNLDLWLNQEAAVRSGT